MWQEIHDKDNWNNLATTPPPPPQASFLQSWQWGEFQESLGREVRRLSWGDKIVVQAIKMPLLLGKSYWYVPRGPVIIDEGANLDSVFLGLDKALGQGDNLFLRTDPISHPPHPPSGRGGLVGFPSSARRGRGGARIIPSAQAQCVRILDIRKSADDLLAAMHPKTRYNINLAQKKGVVIGPGNIDDFLRLNRATRQRDKFRPHPDYYYQTMTEVLSDDKDCHSGGSPPTRRATDRIHHFLRIWQASYRDKVLASAIIVYFGDTASYVHGASSDEHREVMAPHLLHWQIVKEARACNFNYYDLGGVNPPDTNHPAYKKAWEGISRFKAGFGGEIVCYPPSFDLIYQSGWYRVYSVLRGVKKFISLLVY